MKLLRSGGTLQYHQMLNYDDLLRKINLIRYVHYVCWMIHSEGGSCCSTENMNQLNEKPLDNAALSYLVASSCLSNHLN